MIIMGIDSLFAKLPTITNEMKDPEVTVSFIEIYNEKVYDLLSDNSEESIYSKGAKFNGSIKVPITSSAEAYQVIQQGKKNRHVRATKLNGASSRSHAMFSVFLHFRSESSQETLSVMHFCDLAGSEGLRHTNHIGIAQQESVNINRGLLSVSKVVQALSTGKSLIPYRDSVLTVVLQDSLNIRSYITILACISPARGDKSETMSTIRFAQSVKTLDNKNVPELNTYLIEKQVSTERKNLFLLSKVIQIVSILKDSHHPLIVNCTRWRLECTFHGFTSVRKIFEFLRHFIHVWSVFSFACKSWKTYNGQQHAVLAIPN